MKQRRGGGDQRRAGGGDQKHMLPDNKAGVVRTHQQKKGASCNAVTMKVKENLSGEVRWDGRTRLPTGTSDWRRCQSQSR